MRRLGWSVDRGRAGVGLGCGLNICFIAIDGSPAPSRSLVSAGPAFSLYSSSYLPARPPSLSIFDATPVIPTYGSM